jgi:hypothetical protein
MISQAANVVGEENRGQTQAKKPRMAGIFITQPNLQH